MIREDQHFFCCQFQANIASITVYGFHLSWYLLSGDNKHHGRRRHVLLIMATKGCFAVFESLLPLCDGFGSCIARAILDESLSITKNQTSQTLNSLPVMTQVLLMGPPIHPNIGFDSLNVPKKLSGILRPGQEHHLEEVAKDNLDEFNHPSSSLVALLLFSKAGGWYTMTAIWCMGLNCTCLSTRCISILFWSCLNLIGGYWLVLASWLPRSILLSTSKQPLDVGKMDKRR